MKLSEAGESRVRGYLFVLGRSLGSFLPPPVAADALRELESHIRERAASAEAVPDERAALERLLDEVGAPLKVAQAYSGELAIEEAVATGGIGSTARAVWHLATTTVQGFFLALGLLVAYAFGIGFLGIGLVKPLLPNSTGLLVVDGIPRGLGVFGSIPEGGELVGGYWIIPVSITLGLATLVLAHRGAGRFLGWWRSRRASRSVSRIVHPGLGSQDKPS